MYRRDTPHSALSTQGLDLLSLFESAADAVCRRRGAAGADRALQLYRMSGASAFKIVRQLTSVKRPDLAIAYAAGLLAGDGRDTLPPVDRTQLADLLVPCFALAHMGAVEAPSGAASTPDDVRRQLRHFLTVSVTVACTCDRQSATLPSRNTTSTTGATRPTTTTRMSVLLSSWWPLGSCMRHWWWATRVSACRRR